MENLAFTSSAAARAAADARSAAVIAARAFSRVSSEDCGLGSLISLIDLGLCSLADNSARLVSTYEVLLWEEGGCRWRAGRLPCKDGAG